MTVGTDRPMCSSLLNTSVLQSVWHDGWDLIWNCLFGCVKSGRWGEDSETDTDTRGERTSDNWEETGLLIYYKGGLCLQQWSVQHIQHTQHIVTVTCCVIHVACTAIFSCVTVWHNELSKKITRKNKKKHSLKPKKNYGFTLLTNPWIPVIPQHGTWCAKNQNCTRTCDTRFGNTTGLPVPVFNIHSIHSMHSMSKVRRGSIGLSQIRHVHFRNFTHDQIWGVPHDSAMSRFVVLSSLLATVSSHIVPIFRYFGI